MTSPPPPQSLNRSAVMLQDKIARTLNTHEMGELGELRLPRDEQNARGDSVSEPIHTHFAADKY